MDGKPSFCPWHNKYNKIHINTIFKINIILNKCIFRSIYCQDQKSSAFMIKNLEIEQYNYKHACYNYFFHLYFLRTWVFMQIVLLILKTQLPHQLAPSVSFGVAFKNEIGIWSHDLWISILKLICRFKCHSEGLISWWCTWNLSGTSSSGIRGRTSSLSPSISKTWKTK